jgi:hypothetical protein
MSCVNIIARVPPQPFGRAARFPYRFNTLQLDKKGRAILVRTSGAIDENAPSFIDTIPAGGRQGEKWKRGGRAFSFSYRV